MTELSSSHQALSAPTDRSQAQWCGECGMKVVEYDGSATTIGSAECLGPSPSRMQLRHIAAARGLDQ